MTSPDTVVPVIVAVVVDEADWRIRLAVVILDGWIDQPVGAVVPLKVTTQVNAPVVVEFI